jgi:hypothetical protein
VRLGQVWLACQRHVIVGKKRARLGCVERRLKLPCKDRDGRGGGRRRWYGCRAIKRCHSNQGRYLTPVELAQFRHLARSNAAVRGPTPQIAVSLCALAESSCDPATCSLMSRSIRSICFWICLFKLRFNLRTEESLKRAPRFCSMTSKRLKCRR